MWKRKRYLGTGRFSVFARVGGGALLVTSQTIITESYPPEKRGMAQAIYGLGVIIGPTLGPALGRIHRRSFFMAVYFLHQYSYRGYCSFTNAAVCTEAQICGKKL